MQEIVVQLKGLQIHEETDGGGKGGDAVVFETKMTERGKETDLGGQIGESVVRSIEYN